MGAKHPQWVDAEGLSARLVPMLDDADRIVRASAALAVGMLKLQAGAEKLCLLWRNDPISHVRDAALTAMKSVGGPLIEDKLRIEKVLSTHCSHNPDPNPTPNHSPSPSPTPTPNQVLSTHCSNFRAELERKSYQAAKEGGGKGSKEGERVIAQGMQAAMEMVKPPPFVRRFSSGRSKKARVAADGGPADSASVEC